ncbi:MAG TPA: hypothetical protein VGO27_06335 [Candidatus Acidoferrum sp.]|nr:hypothetical protein [Candidatus Acidoferrum sp.]
MHAIAELDFMGSVPDTAATHFPSVYLALTACWPLRRWPAAIDSSTPDIPPAA